MKKDKTLSLAELVSRVMSHPDCPVEFYDAMADALDNMQSGPAEKDTPAWIQFKLDRYRELEEKGE